MIKLLISNTLPSTYQPGYEEAFIRTGFMSLQGQERWEGRKIGHGRRVEG